MADQPKDEWITPPEATAPRDEWVTPQDPLTKAAAVAKSFTQGEQSSLYDPKNPVQSDDPRYWPPIKKEQWRPWWQRIWEAGPFSGKSQGPERATFLPLKIDEQGKRELAVPGIAYDPVEAQGKIWEKYKGGIPSYRENLEIGGEALSGSSLAVPGGPPMSRVLPKPAVVGRFSRTVEGAAQKRAARALLENAESNLPSPVRPGVTASIKNWGRETADPNNYAVTPEEILKGSESQIARGQAQGQDMRLVDTGGESTRNELGRSRDLSDRSGQQAKNVFDARSTSQSVRMIEWLRKRLGNPAEADTEIAQIKENARDPKSRAYQQAYEDGKTDPAFGTAKTTKSGRKSKTLHMDPGGVKPPPDIIVMMQDDTMKKYAREAEKKYNTFQTAKITHQDLPIEPFDGPGPKAAFNPVGLPLEYWDRLVRIMSDDIQGKRLTAPDDAMGITVLRKKIVDMLDVQFPSYKRARGIAAEAFGAVDAVEAGQNLANSRKLPGEIAAIARKVGAEEWGRVQVGFWTEYLRKLSYTGESRDIVKYLANNPGERQKIAAVLGADLGRELEMSLYIEKLMEQSKNTVLGGSPTTKRQHRSRSPSILPSAVAAGAIASWFGNPWLLLSQAFIYGLQQTEARFRLRVAERTAELLLSNDPREVARGFKSAQQFLPNMRKFILAIPALGTAETHKEHKPLEVNVDVPYRTDKPMHLGGPTPEDSPGVDASKPQEEKPPLDPKVMRTLQQAGLPIVPAMAGNPEIQDVARRWFRGAAGAGPLGAGEQILKGEEPEELTSGQAGALLTVGAGGYGRAAAGGRGLGMAGGRAGREALTPIIEATNTRLAQMRDGIKLLEDHLKSMSEHIGRVKPEHRAAWQNDFNSLKATLDGMRERYSKLSYETAQRAGNRGGEIEFGVFGSRPPGGKPPRNVNPRDQAFRAQTYQGGRGLGMGPGTATPAEVLKFWYSHNRNKGRIAKMAEDLNIPEAMVRARLKHPAWGKPDTMTELEQRLSNIPVMRNVNVRPSSRSTTALRQLRRAGFTESAIYKTLANEFGAEETQRIMQAFPPEKK